MKNILLVLFCLATLYVSGQQFRYGAHISPAAGFWKVEGDLYVAQSPKFNFQGGIILDQTIGKSERFSFTTGLSFNSAPAGFQSSQVKNEPLKIWNFSVTSLELPLAFRLRSDQLNKTVLFAQYGFNLGFTLNTKVTNDAGKEVGQEFGYEKVNPSLLMGFGMEYAMSDNIDLIFSLYLQNGMKNMVIDNANDDNMFPQQVGLRCGILF